MPILGSRGFGRWTVSAAGGQSAYELISTTTLSSNTNTVTLSSIPATYKHLRLILTGRSSFANTGTSNVFMRMNGDSSSSYWHHLLEVQSSSAYNSNPGSTQTQARIGITSQNNSTAGYWGGIQIEMPDYTSTNKYRVARVSSRMDTDTGTAFMDYGSALYISTAALSSVSFYLDQGDWISGSRFSIYGLSG
jgi:hypothetical protein